MSSRILLLALFFAVITTDAFAADVRATWDPVTLDEQGGQESVDHYMLYWGQTSRPGTVTRPTDGAFSYDQSQDVGNNTSSQQSGFTPGQTYYFSVAAVDLTGNISAYSAEVTVVIPGGQDGGLDAGTDGGGQDAGGDEPPADGEIVVEGTCGCSGATDMDLWLIALLAVPLVRRKREQY